jgi:hypothetical protein
MIASRASKKERSAGLQLHSIYNQLEEQRVAVLRCQLDGLVVLAGLGDVEVALGDNTVGTRLGWEEGLTPSVLGDQLLLDDPEDLSPDFADGVYTPVAGLVESLVGRGVDDVVGRVRVVSRFRAMGITSRG